MSDAKDPSYKLPETYSETSCSSYNGECLSMEIAYFPVNRSDIRLS